MYDAVSTLPLTKEMHELHEFIHSNLLYNRYVAQSYHKIYRYFVKDSGVYFVLTVNIRNDLK